MSQVFPGLEVGKAVGGMALVVPSASFDTTEGFPAAYFYGGGHGGAFPFGRPTLTKVMDNDLA